MLENTFEFNGILSSDLNIYIMNYNGGSSLETVETEGLINFITSKAGNSDIWNMHGSTAESPLSFSFQIGKYNCNNSSNYLFNRAECAFIKNWLEVRSDYKWFRFMFGSYKDTYFKSKLTIKFIQCGFDKYGAEVTVTCNAPYGFSDVQTFSDSDITSFTLYNDTDLVGNIIFDKFVITSGTAGELTITNDLDSMYSDINNTTTITCYANEEITISGSNRQITSTDASEDIHKRFNYKYPRLIFMYDDYMRPYRANTFTLSKTCSVDIEYRTIRAVVA